MGGLPPQGFGALTPFLSALIPEHDLVIHNLAARPEWIGAPGTYVRTNPGNSNLFPINCAGDSTSYYPDIFRVSPHPSNPGQMFVSHVGEVETVETVNADHAYRHWDLYAKCGAFTLYVPAGYWLRAMDICRTLSIAPRIMEWRFVEVATLKVLLIE